MRDIIALACTECKRRNYSTTKNKKKTSERLELSKYCRFCRCHKPHRETKELAGGELWVRKRARAKRRARRERSEPPRRRASERVGESEGRRPSGDRRTVAQLAEHRSPKPGVGGSIPSCPARLR